MALDFCSCGSLKVNGKCTNKGCPSKKGHPSTIKNKGWKMGGTFMDFDEPVTFEEAVKCKQELDMLLLRKGEPDGKKDNSV